MSTAVVQADQLNAITEQIIGAAMEVHRVLGPGLLESAYEACLVFELREHCRVGLLLNFHCTMLKHGIRRLVNNFPSSACSATSAVKRDLGGE